MSKSREVLPRPTSFHDEKKPKEPRPMRLPVSKEKETEAPPKADWETSPAAPASPPDAGEAWCCSATPAELALLVPESEAGLTLEALEKQLEDLKELQCQYLQGQLRVRRLCQQFPRSLRALSLQICHARRRLIRVEVRLKRQEGEGPLSPGGPAQLPSFEGLRATSASTLTHKPISPVASNSQGALTLASSLSSVSLPLHPFPALPPSPPPSLTDLGDLKDVLATLLELQAHHLQDRKRDLRGCQECLRSIRTLRAQLRSVRKRLSALELQLGIQVPPRELDADVHEEEEEEEEEGPPLPLAALDTPREGPEERRM